MALELTRENTVFTTKGQCGYFSVLRMPSNKIRIYYRSSFPETDVGWSMPTRYLDSDDGITFSQPEDDIIFEKSGICHNFLPFIETNPDAKMPLKGVGGCHWKRKDPYWNLRDRHKDVEKDTSATLGYRGVYIFDSQDGLKWNLLQKHPIVTRRHPGFCTRRKQPSEFDSAISCLYDNKTNKYRLWVRSNVKQDVRFIQETESEDFYEWTPFKLITFKPIFDFKSNYYFPSFYRHPDNERFLGLVPYCNEKKAMLRLCISEDGHKWRKIEDVLTESPIATGRKKKLKNYSHSVNGYVLSADKKQIYFYVHHNYFQLKPKRPVKIVRYSMDFKELMKF